jgi:hypothetical protein
MYNKPTAVVHLVALAKEAQLMKKRHNVYLWSKEQNSDMETTYSCLCRMYGGKQLLLNAVFFLNKTRCCGTMKKSYVNSTMGSY